MNNANGSVIISSAETAKELLESAEDDQRYARYALSAAHTQLKIAVLGVKRAQDQSVRADFKVGRVRYAVRNSEFPGLLHKRRCHRPVQKFNNLRFVVTPGPQRFRLAVRLD